MKKTKLGQILIRSLNEAIEYEKGRKELKTSTISVPESAREWSNREIAQIRKERFKVSQPIFASILSVRPATIRAWEQGLKRPSGAAARLLEVAEAEPETFTRLIAKAHARKR
ncbi:MAG: transcriptional regulator [Deltaproteobacteria bacterium]|nr:transcriptional regulator [Deltaproteobacteria bacterium]